MGVFEMLIPTHDPRSDWDTKDAQLDAIEREREHYVKVAVELGDPESFRVAEADRDDLKAARAASRAARAPLDEMFAALAVARTELVQAQAADSGGSLDAKAAVRSRERVVAAEAKLRYYSVRLPGLTASASGMRDRVSLAANVATSRSVVEETMSFVKKIFEYSRLEGVLVDAENCGRRSRADRVAWWPIAEHLALAAFRERLPREKRERRGRGVESPHGFVRDPRDEEQWMPSEADLRRCFASRREAFAAERRRVEMQMKELGGALESFGAAQ
jgi:hypothetical protein